jgi:hypothetical protein
VAASHRSSSSPNASTTNASTITPSQRTISSSECSLNSDRISAEAIPWDQLKFGHLIFAARKYAYCTDDIYLLSAWLEIAEVKDIDSKSAALLLKMLKLLHQCSYSAVDICSILAHASSYFIDVFSVCGGYMDAAEVGNVLATVSFLAHSYIQDETCPLHVWHKHLFRGYCKLKKLSEAVVRIMAIRKYVLRLETSDLSARFQTLCAAVRMPPVEQVS